jgi:glycosyltransferase involved in cell wall biosynthesis
MRVLFLNDYPMGKARELNRQGLYPSQHLWGMAEIEQFGITPVYFPDETWLGEPSRYKFSIQQLQAWLDDQGCDAIYSACQFNTWLLARLRRLGLLRIPLVTLVHHPLASVLQNRAYVAGHDGLVFLNESVRQLTLDRFGASVKRSATLPWGPDLAFFKPGAADAQAPCDVLAAGKTNRDFKTLIEAAKGQSWLAKVYCAHRNLAGVGDVPPNVEVHANESGIVLNYKQLYEVSAAAQIIAVPLVEVDALAGLTSVVDALALGKPLVMTRNKWLDLDPEAEGFGLTVAPNDVEGWRQAVTMILGDSSLRERMSQAARDVAQRLNMTLFAKGLAGMLHQVVTKPKS